MIGKAIFSRLTTDPDVRALVGTRVFPDAAPKGKLPFIVYEIQDSDTQETYDAIGPVSATVELTLVGTSVEQVDDLAAKIRALFDGEDGTWGGVEIQGAFLEGDSSGSATVEGIPDEQYPMRVQQYLFWANL